MSLVTIRSIITTALVTWATDKNIPVEREGQPFDKPINHATYIQMYLLPHDTQVATLDGSRRRHTGDAFINIWVQDGTGTGEAESLADELVNLFPVYPNNFAPLSIETVPSVKRSMLDDSGWRITPVVFGYRLEA